jgi:hypothetical protein
VPRARLMQPDGGTTEWKSEALRAYQRRTRAAEALIAGAYLAGVNTRRVRRALAALKASARRSSGGSPSWIDGQHLIEPFENASGDAGRFAVEPARKIAQQPLGLYAAPRVVRQKRVGM